MIGDVFAEVDRSFQKHQLVEIPGSARIGIRLFKVESGDPRRSHQIAHCPGGGGISHHKDAVDFVLCEKLFRLLVVDFQKRRRTAGLDVVGAKRQRQHIGPRAFLAHCQLFP